MEKTSKKSGGKGKLMIAVILAGGLFLAELYVMMHMPQSIGLLVGIGVGILVSLCLAVSTMVDSVNQKDLVNGERYENIHKSEKASYILLKKKLEELSKQVEALEHNSNKSDNSAEIIKAQKAIAKVTMNKTKEAQDRLFIELNDLEASLNDRVRELAKRLSGFQEEIERLADHIAKINAEAIQEAVRGSQQARAEYKETKEELFHEPEIEEETEEDILDLDFLGLDLEEEPILESEPIPEPEPVPVKPADSGEKMGQDDIAALIASMTGGASDPEPMPEPAPSPVKPVDSGEKMDQDDIAALIASMTGGASDPEPMPEPEPIPVKPVDSGEKMGQDDIAALIASMTGGASEAEPIPEPVPEPIPVKPVDNGEKMGQDDIAALIASMTGGASEPELMPEPVPEPVKPVDNGEKMDQDDIAALIASMTGGM